MPMPAQSVRPKGAVMYRTRVLGQACGIVAAASLLMLLSGCSSRSAESAEDSADFAEAQVRTFDVSTLASGELQARDRVELRSKVERPTTVVEIVPEGSRVEAGDVLVRLNSDEIKRDIEEQELQLAEAQLNLEAAETAYDIQVSDNAANLRKAKLKVDLARLTLEQWAKGDKVKKLKELQTAIEKASRDLDRLKEKKAKSDELYEKKFISYDEWKRDEIALLEAEARFETTRLDMDVYVNYQMKRDEAQKKSDLAEAEKELERVRQANEINLKNKDSARQNRSVQLSRRKERLAEYRKQLEACTITAPKAGLVVYGSTAQRDNWRWQSEGPISVGRQIHNNDLLITLPDTSEMIASVKVHESMAGRVRPGQHAVITIEAAGGLTLGGTVESIGLLAENGGWRDPNRREYTVRIAVDSDGQGEKLKPSMRCQAEIILGTVHDALSVPVQSVFSDGPVRYVLVPDGPRLARRPVMLGRRSDLYAEIIQGLDEGQPVLVREPKAGEIIEEPWDPEELARAGYGVDEEGKPFVRNARRRGGPGGPAATRHGGRRGAGGAKMAGDKPGGDNMNTPTD
ncbi:MAG TPA: HlyD family efflux transporter periplasmic adaptor subunit [Phycisphaerales bacterium]|nr:HlyD family efflux transporter periplasmic adaptor subunit [Phycisphaerales bacterium]